MFWGHPETMRLLNTYKYLTYLLSQRPDAKMSDEQLEQLAPWSETAKANCQN